MERTRLNKSLTISLYETYYRFLETEDEYFDYAPAPVPPQERWRIYGLGLPDGIVKKVDFEMPLGCCKSENDDLGRR